MTEPLDILHVRSVIRGRGTSLCFCNKEAGSSLVLVRLANACLECVLCCMYVCVCACVCVCAHECVCAQRRAFPVAWIAQAIHANMLRGDAPIKGVGGRE